MAGTGGLAALGKTLTAKALAAASLELGVALDTFENIHSFEQELRYQAGLDPNDTTIPDVNDHINPTVLTTLKILSSVNGFIKKIKAGFTKVDRAEFGDFGYRFDEKEFLKEFLKDRAQREVIDEAQGNN